MYFTDVNVANMRFCLIVFQELYVETIRDRDAF